MMKNNEEPIIQVKNLSKEYKIGIDTTYKTLSGSITDTLRSPLSVLKNFNKQNESFWALKDINFEVNRGEVVGIIGRNGAGKSTLLKVLSRITHPTEGEVRLRGRVGSLLEVGTGFHPELTGRENVYFNGAILGMKKREIEDKFEEIVKFSGVEKFLDTPVKRYSSGMYVRLAFAVAAHMEPEILIVDEVLAVGDAQFQKKCLGKMSEVAEGGRTVLFVSHNMGAVRTLCNRVILIEEGKLTLGGEPSQVISTYLSSRTTNNSEIEGQILWTGDKVIPPGTDEICLRGLRVTGPDGIPQSIFEADKVIKVEIFYEIKKPIRGQRFNLYVLTQEGEIAFLATDYGFRKESESPGVYKSECIIPEKLLNIRSYIIAISCDIPGVKILIPREEYLNISISGAGNQASTFPEGWPGVVCPHLNWNISEIVSATIPK